MTKFCRTAGAVMFFVWLAGISTMRAGLLPQLSDLQAPGGGELQVESVEGQRVKVSSPNWRLEFDLRNGGILDTVVFPYGSGKNLLVRPFRSAVGPWCDGNAPQTEFRSSRQDQVFRLEFSGRMAATGREAGPVRFVTTWTLSPFTIRVDQQLELLEDVTAAEVDIGSVGLRRDLDEFGVRVGPTDDADPRKQGPASFGALGKTDGPMISKHHAPLYLLFFHRGLEGLDLTVASDLETWETALTKKGGTGRYLATAAADGSAIDVLRQPLFSSTPVVLRKGSYVFSYYLGLPRIVEKSDRKWRHLSFGNHPWPSDAAIQRWAENGVNVVRLHNDYTEDENFWHDGAWPPYDAAGMAELKRVIAACHRHKIKVVPYFSVHEFHPKAEGYLEHEQEWKRSTDQAGSVYHNLWGKGEFGAQMCPQSGWLEKRKRDIERAYRELGFDGIYYDWVWGLPCNNKNHDSRLHMGTDGIVNLLAWTRRLVSPQGILILHLYGQFPSIALENYADLVVNMEEISDSDHFMRLDEVPLVTVLAESLPRSPCPSYRTDQALQRNRNNIAQLVVLGMFPWAGETEDPVLDETLKLFRAFRPYALENFRLHDAYSGAVQAGWKDVYGAIYGSKNSALVVISNTSQDAVRNVSWIAKPELLGFQPDSRRVRIKDTITGKEQELPEGSLTDGSLRVDLEGYQYRIMEVRPAP